MLDAKVFHVNAIDKLSKMQEMLSEFLARLDDDALISTNATEIKPSASADFYSYTVVVFYRKKQA